MTVSNGKPRNRKITAGPITCSLAGCLMTIAFPLIFLCFFLGIGMYIDKNTDMPISGEIVSLYPVPVESGGGQLYRIHLKYDDGSVEVFNLMASPAYGQLEVGTIFGQLKVGDRIEATAVGVDWFYFIGAYRNLVNIEIAK